jgi:S1-C subfamily serine protease
VKKKPAPQAGKRKVYFLQATAIFLFLGVAFIPLQSASPEEAKESVVIVDATVEVSPNPFLFFFSRTFTKPEKRTTHYRGSGFVVNGHLITAAHVVLADPGDKVLSICVISFHGESTEVAVVRTDKDSDLAELAPVKGATLTLPTLTLTNRTPSVGDKVVEIGHPGMIHFVISRGEIVGFDRDQNYNIATLDTFGGNSGGPVLNSSGRVVGLTHTLLRGSRFTGIGTLNQLRDFLYPERVR